LETIQAKKGSSVRHVGRAAWSGSGFAAGSAHGVTVSATGIAFASSTGTVDYTDPHAATPTARTYEFASWVSPVVTPGFGLTELVASWNAATPGESWIEVVVRGRQPDGTPTPKDYVLGRWAAKDPDDGGGIYRTSLNGQGDTVATVYTDTLATRS